MALYITWSSQHNEGTFDSASLLNDWANYLANLGQISAAALRYEQCRSIVVRTENWAFASTACANLGSLLITAGRLTRVVEVLEDGRKLSRRLRWAIEARAHTFIAHAYAVLGAMAKSLTNLTFIDSLPPESRQEVLTSGWFGVRKSMCLPLLGRFADAKELSIQNILDCAQRWGHDNRYIYVQQLVQADVALKCGDHGLAQKFIRSTQDWAVSHDERELLCWSALIRTKIELSAFSERNSAKIERQRILESATTSLDDGLKIARHYGFAIYHIDLLLERARLHLLCGNPQTALDDLRVALDEGIAANAHTGQPELLAATHAECGYAWAIAAGLHLRGEALLLQGAQSLGSDSFVVVEWTQLPADVQALIDQAEICLTEALYRWHPLRDPEPNNANFVHPKTGIEYNYRAAETYRLLDELAGGVFTRYPLRQPTVSAEVPSSARTDNEAIMSFHVFLSHNSKDKPTVRQLGMELKQRGLNVWLDEWELRPGLTWQDALEHIIQTCGSAAVCVVENGIGPWEDPEMKALLRRFINEKKVGNVLPVIPVLLPGAPADIKLPIFLEAFTWVDLRTGFTKEGLDKLVWGITGKKPNP